MKKTVVKGSARSAKNRLGWPARPYNGLRQYSYSDAALFAGRTRETKTCADELLRSELSLFLLDGDSGCGKTSFLHAGLLPYLDGLSMQGYSEGVGQSRGSRLQTASIGTKRVIRSGRKPLESLAGAAYDVIQKLTEKKTKFPKSLQQARLGCRLKKEYIAKTGDNELDLFESLAHISLSVDHRLLIVIDQAEDIFASSPGGESDEREYDQAERQDQDKYFSLLSLFASESIDMKLLISLRREFKPQFDDALRRRRIDPSCVGSYHLQTIAPDGIIDAIIRPTLQNEFTIAGQNLPPPFKKYGFRYSNNLPQIIMEEVVASSANNRGARLPILQVICDRLYSHWLNERSSPKPKNEITEADYRGTGSANAQIASHLEEKLVEFYVENQSSKQVDFADQADRWRRVLFSMAEVRDGMARAKISVDERELLKTANRNECLKPKEMLGWLKGNERYILQQVAFGETADSKGWKLVHDTIAVSLAGSTQADLEKCYTERSRTDSVLEAEKLTSKELYASGPDVIRFRTINDLIWDHQIPIYAEKKGFTTRLGLEIKADPEFDLTIQGNSTVDYGSFMSPERRRGQYRLVVLPGQLFSSIRSAPWITVGIPNTYRGFAIFGRQREGLVPLQDPTHPVKPEESRSRLARLARTLARKGTRIVAFEEASAKFVEYIIQWARLSGKSAKRVEVVAPQTERYTAARDPMFTKLVEGQCDFALGPAPSRALAEQAGFVVFADFSDIEHLTRGKLREKIINLKLHELWVVDLSPKETACLMRLASVMLYTVEYIRGNPDDFVRFLYNDMLSASSEGAYPLQRQFIRAAVSACYNYVSIEEYFFEYLTPSSESYFRHSGPHGPAPVFKQLMEYRMKCDRILGKVGSKRRLDRTVRGHFERARRHYQIFNYYDAFDCLLRVERTLGTR